MKLSSLLDHRNSIQFTLETEITDLLFLYIDMCRRPAGFWCYRLYIKPTYIKQYINVTPLYPVENKLIDHSILYAEPKPSANLKSLDAELEFL
jgi:hypothetical protein